MPHTLYQRSPSYQVRRRFQSEQRSETEQRRGRPSQVPDAARSKRAVTFVTERELEGLEQIAQEEDRSLSAVVHRIIAQYLKNTRLEENK